MKKSHLIYSLGHAVLVVAYVSMVAWVLTNAEKIFKDDPSIVGPISFLLLLVLSATIVGSLVFGKPILLYLDGQKKEAVNFLFFTALWILVGTVIFILLNLK